MQKQGKTTCKKHVTRMPHGYGFAETENNFKHFWKSVESAMEYNPKDAAKLIVVDGYFSAENKDDFTPEQAITRILKYTSLQLEDTFPHSGSGGGWVAVFAKVKI